MEINGIEVDVDLRYSEMNLSQGILKALDQKGFTLATPVQAGAIPCFKDWKDVMAKAPTGSGKTFAFGIPMVEHTDPEGTEVTGLVLAPTRELALQIQEELRQLCAFLPGIRVACLYGGQPIDRQITQLKKRPQIVVATPGRLMDHMKRRTVRLHKVETVVLDEADRMLDMGFIKDVTHILKQIPHRRNLGLFSATISREVMDISWVYQRDPVEIVVRPVQENRPKISQYRLKVDMGGKVDLLAAILEREHLDRVIVFCNTKNTTDRITGLLRMRGSPPSASTATWARRSGKRCSPPSGPASSESWWPPMWPPGGWTSTTWTGSSIMIFRKRGNTMSTALGGPAGPSTRARPTTSSPPSPTTSAWTKSSATTSTT